MKIRIIDTPVSKASNQTGLYATRNHLPLIARILLAALFLWSGVNKVLHPAETQAYMAAHGMPFTGVFLIAAIVLELGAGLALFLGIYPQVAATALALFTLMTAFIFHRNLADPMQQIQFMKNLSILGGLLMVVQYGAGNVALRLGQRR